MPSWRPECGSVKSHRLVEPLKCDSDEAEAGYLDLDHLQRLPQLLASVKSESILSKHKYASNLPQHPSQNSREHP